MEDRILIKTILLILIFHSVLFIFQYYVILIYGKEIIKEGNFLINRIYTTLVDIEIFKKQFQNLLIYIEEIDELKEGIENRYSDFDNVVNQINDIQNTLNRFG